jgi:molecular chaperone GrpE
MAEEAEDRLNNKNQTGESSEANNEEEDSAGGGQERVATPAGAAAETEGGERSARMNAAKAFYRAMYAGEDVAPDDFGMGGGAPRSDGARSCGNCASMQQQMSQIEAKASEVENLYKRMAADFDNFRKRTEREREELLGLGAQRAIENILPAIDDLDRAQGSFNSESEARNILESLKLVYNRFTKCLEQMGVKSMDVVGQPFDPKYHEPVQQIETNEQPEGAIVHDLRRGYLMRDKVIRPSLVNVATRPETNEVAEPTPAAEEVKALEEAEAAPVLETQSPPPLKSETKEAEVPKQTYSASDVASATAELPAFDATANVEAKQVNLRTHQNAEDEKEKQNEEGAHAEHKRPHATDDEKKASENSIELAEMKAYADRQSADE